MPTKRTFRNQPLIPGFSRKTGPLAHGGELSKGKRKIQRPFDPKQALHVVLRSSKAKGRQSLLHPNHCNLIQQRLTRLAKRWNISIYRYANVGNHIHLLLRARARADWQGFIREFSGTVAMIVTGARKGHGLARESSLAGVPICEVSPRGFWDHLVFTRIVRFGKDFSAVAQYVLKNVWEVAGVPVRRIQARGFRILEFSEDGIVFGMP